MRKTAAVLVSVLLYIVVFLLLFRVSMGDRILIILILGVSSILFLHPAACNEACSEQ